jgi:hypothetical protein
LVIAYAKSFGFFTEGNEENEDFRSGGGQSLCFLCLLAKAFGVIFCLESSPVLRAPTPPGAPRHPPSHSFGVAGSEAATTFYERFL